MDSAAFYYSVPSLNLSLTYVLNRQWVMGGDSADQYLDTLQVTKFRKLIRTFCGTP